MSFLTVTEIRHRIEKLDNQIAVASQAESYSLSSGLSSQSVKRQTLSSLLQLRDYWLSKLEETIVAESDSQGFRFVPIRGWQR